MPRIHLRGTRELDCGTLSDMTQEPTLCSRFSLMPGGALCEVSLRLDWTLALIKCFQAQARVEYSIERAASADDLGVERLNQRQAGMSESDDGASSC